MPNSSAEDMAIRIPASGRRPPRVDRVEGTSTAAWGLSPTKVIVVAQPARSDTDRRERPRATTRRLERASTSPWS